MEQIQQSIVSCPEFNEFEYLNSNPDVANKVATTPGFSGWQHFIESGYLENRSGVTPAVYVYVQKQRDYSVQRIVAPPNLRRRVHGSDDLRAFENTGRVIAENVFGRLMRVARDANEFRVLDFGVGCGRTLRPLAALCENTALTTNPVTWWGSDIDSQAVEWCQKFLNPLGVFCVNHVDVPLPFNTCQFDFIYSISFFTHLPEDMQFTFLSELQRVLKDDGTVVISTHSFDLVPEDWKSNIVRDGFYYHVGSGTDGFPAFYQTAFHSHEYIRSTWSKYFKIEGIYSKGIAHHQDLVVCKKVDAFKLGTRTGKRLRKYLELAWPWHDRSDVLKRVSSFWA